MSDIVTGSTAMALELTALRAENERLKIENIQMQAALGYGILAEDERHILPSNPFKCGTCDASKHLRAEIEDLGNRLHHVHRLWANNEHALRAENERLRAALRDIIADSFSVYAIEVARAALEEKP